MADHDAADLVAAARVAGEFSSWVDLVVDGAAVVYHRDRSVAWATADVAEEGVETNDATGLKTERASIKRARSCGELRTLFDGKTEDECRTLVDDSDSKLLKMHDGGRRWIVLHGTNNATGASRYAEFLRYRYVYCECGARITVSSGNTGNLAKHEKMHTGAVASRGSSDIRVFKKARVLPPAVSSKRVDVERVLRALTTAAFVSAGVNPHQLRITCASDTVSCRALHALLESGVSLGAGVPADLDLAEKIVDDAIRLRVSGKRGALVTDGATYQHKHAFGVMFVCEGLSDDNDVDAVLLDLVFPKDGHDGVKVYDHTAAAETVRAAAGKFGIDIIRHCSVLQGDNVEFNTALARSLGLPRGRCLPHALNVFFKNGVKDFPLFHDIVVGGGGSIYAGGSGTRAADLDAHGLEAKKMVPYMNRFGTAIAVVGYLNDNFASVKQWFCTSSSLPLDGSETFAELQRQIAAGDDEDDKKKKLSDRTKRAAGAYSNKGTPVMLHLVSNMFKKIPALITDASGEGDSVPHDLVERLVLLGETTDVHAENGAVAVNQAVAFAYPAATAALKTQMLNMFVHDREGRAAVAEGIRYACQANDRVAKAA